MPHNRTKTLIALTFAALTGCEAVAGIKDISLSEDDAGGNPGDDATTAPDQNSDEASPPDAASADSPANVETSSDAAITDSASPDAIDATTSPDATSPPDAALEADARAADHAAPPDAPVADARPDSSGNPGGDAAVDAGFDASDGALIGADGGLLVTELIDDMEHQTGAIALMNGRDGFWYSYADGTDGGVLTPPVGGMPSSIISAIVPPRGTSMFASHVSGSGFNQFAGMGFDMVDMSGTKELYDASAYQGFVFWARSSTGPMAMRFSVPDVNTDKAGGVCTSCGDNFNTMVMPPLTTAWQQYVVYFNQLAQVGFGHPNGGDPGGPTGVSVTQIFGCQFQVSAPAATTGFDVWIDDIDFIRK